MASVLNSRCGTIAVSILLHVSILLAAATWLNGRDQLPYETLVSHSEPVKIKFSERSIGQPTVGDPVVEPQPVQSRQSKGRPQSVRADRDPAFIGKAPSGGIGDYMPERSIVLENYRPKFGEGTGSHFDPVTNISAVEKSRVMPALLKIAREISLQVTMPNTVRELAREGSAQADIKMIADGDWDVRPVTGEVFLRAFLYERMKLLSNDPVINEAYRTAELPRVRIKFRLQSEHSSGHQLATNSLGYQIDGYQITIMFQGMPLQGKNKKNGIPYRQWRSGPASVALSPMGAQAGFELGPVEFMLVVPPTGGLGLGVAPSQKEARRKAEFEQDQMLDLLRSSPAFASPIK